MVWLDAANEAKASKLHKVSLYSTEERPLSVQDIVSLKNAGNTYKVGG